MTEHNDFSDEETANVGSRSHHPRQRRVKTPGAGKQVACCSAMTTDGRPCPLRPMTGRDQCYQHSEDPGIVEERAVARRLGGLNATHQRYLPPDIPPPALDNPEGVRKVLADTIQQVRTGQVPPAVGNAVVYAVATSLRLAELELSAKVAKLEKAILERKREG